jgi:O-antigen ligase
MNGMAIQIISIVVVCIITSVIFYKPYLGIAFVIISIPFEGSMILDCVSVYPIEVVLAILVLVCISKLVVGRENYFRNTKLVYCCIPFVLCIMLSALKTIELSLTVKEIVRWLELFLIYYLTINLVKDGKESRIILYSLLLTLAIAFTCGIISDYNDVRSTFLGYRAAFIFGNPNPFAGYVDLVIPVFFGMTMVSVLLWERIMLGAFTILSVIVLFLTFSRAAWLYLLLTIILISFLAKVKKKGLSLFVILIITFAASLLSSNIKGNLMNRFRLKPTLISLDKRVSSYSVGFDMVNDNLILGIGIGNYPLLIKESTKITTIIQSNLHNMYLQVFVETGIIGLSAFIFWLVCVTKHLMSSLRALGNSKHYWLFVGLMGGVIVYLFNNLTDVLVVHGIHLQWGIILGLAVVLTQFRESETCPKMV